VKADPKVVSDLQLACGLLATIAEQYRLDGYLIRNLGLKDLGRKFYPKWSAGYGSLRASAPMISSAHWWRLRCH
jgi:hypothetical protein